MFEEVQRLLSTLIVLAFIKFRLSIEFPLILPLGATFEVFKRLTFLLILHLRDYVTGIFMSWVQKTVKIKTKHFLSRKMVLELQEEEFLEEEQNIIFSL